MHVLYHSVLATDKNKRISISELLNFNNLLITSFFQEQKSLEGAKMMDNAAKQKLASLSSLWSVVFPSEALMNL
jgi:hypothetical protein